MCECAAVFYKAIQVRSVNFGIVECVDGPVREIVRNHKKKVRTIARGPARRLTTESQHAWARGQRSNEITPLRSLYPFNNLKTALSIPAVSASLC
jgi:hypothetical protein